MVDVQRGDADAEGAGLARGRMEERSRIAAAAERDGDDTARVAPGARVSAPWCR